MIGIGASATYGGIAFLAASDLMEGVAAGVAGLTGFGLIAAGGLALPIGAVAIVKQC